MRLLEGRHALITGGASGIGLATAGRFVQEGATVAVVDVNDDGQRAAEDVGAFFLQADVSDSSQVEQAFQRAEEAMGKIDIAHLNAGVTTQQGDITQLTDAQYRRIQGANIDGVVFGAREAARAMQRAGGGSIVVTASMAGVIAFSPDPIYTLTKHAVVGLVRALAQQLEPKHITINAICPSIVETPLVGPGAQRLKEAGFPLIQPSAIADAVVQAITGQGTGQAFVCQADRPPEVYEWAPPPGPRTPGRGAPK